ncbi:hypothetical protein P7K49_007402, partial [Saguinus oedipus]
MKSFQAGGEPQRHRALGAITAHTQENGDGYSAHAKHPDFMAARGATRSKARNFPSVPSLPVGIGRWPKRRFRKSTGRANAAKQARKSSREKREAHASPRAPLTSGFSELFSEDFVDNKMWALSVCLTLKRNRLSKGWSLLSSINFLLLVVTPVTDV